MNGQAEPEGAEAQDSEPVNEGLSETAAHAEPEEQAGDPLAELAAKADENWDKYLRTAAELENVRKRAARDVENARRFALERFATELLGVCDSLEMGLAAGAGTDAAALLEGSQATLKQLLSTLDHFGVAVLDPEGEPFDPEYHEAMTMQPSADLEPGSVLTVFQKGLHPQRTAVAPGTGRGRAGPGRRGIDVAAVVETAQRVPTSRPVLQFLRQYMNSEKPTHG